MHIDTDVFMWKRLPRWLEEEPVIAQHPEYFSENDGCYQLDAVEAAMHETGGVLPEEWLWTHARGPHQRSENCGICGGADVRFLNYYASVAKLAALRAENRAGWLSHANTWVHNMMVEQYALAACIEYHRHRGDSLYRDVRPGYVFASWGDACDPAHAAQAGYTHLQSGAKRHPAAVHGLRRGCGGTFLGMLGGVGSWGGVVKVRGR